MEITNNQFYIINGIQYMAIATYENYSLLLNNSNFEFNGSGSLILVKNLSDNNFAVIKDNNEITTIVNKMLNNNDNK